MAQCQRETPGGASVGGDSWPGPVLRLGDLLQRDHRQADVWCDMDHIELVCSTVEHSQHSVPCSEQSEPQGIRMPVKLVKHSVRVRSSRSGLARVIFASALGLLPLIDPDVALAQSTKVYVVDSSGRLGAVDVTAGTSTVIGYTGATLTDIAVTSSGALWGVDRYGTYSLNKATGAGTYVGSLGVGAGNMVALVGRGTDLLAASGWTTSLYAVNTATGRSTPLTGNTGFFASGDLAFHAGTLYASVRNGGFSDLLRINLQGSTFTATNLGHVPVASDLYSLVNGTDGNLYGISGTTVWRLNTSNPAASSVVVPDYAANGSGLGPAYGAASGASLDREGIEIANTSMTNGMVSVTAISGCSWTAVSNASWITVTGGSSGIGDGSVTFSVASNGGTPRSGTLTIAGYTVTVTQGSTFSNPTPITLADAAVGAPYPSTVNVSGLAGLIGGVSVTLHGLSHSAPADLDMVLVGPTGQAFQFMSDVGGRSGVTGLTMAFADHALAPPSTRLTLGSFKPTNIGLGDSFPAPGPLTNYLSPAPAGAATFAGVFGGSNPNGSWRLYVLDDLSVGQGVLVGGWSLSIELNASAALPGVPASPSPADRASVTASPVTVDWADAQYATSYDVYVDGALQATVATSHWALNQSLLPGAHSWSVVAKNTFGVTPGPSWSFFVVVTRQDFVVQRVNDGVIETTSVFIKRVDRPSEPIYPDMNTWVVVHGRGSSSTASNIATLSAALTVVARRAGEQVLVLDWEGGAGLPGFEGEGWIEPVGKAAASALAAYGFEGRRLNLIGHSWGSYVSDELAEAIPFERSSAVARVHSIVGLDPARNTTATNYNVNDPGEINFAAHSTCSWAFLTSQAGNAETPGTAREAFVVNFDLDVISPENTRLSHSLAVNLFAEMLDAPRDSVSAYFGLDLIRSCSPGPWALNRLNAAGDRGFGPRAYEARINASGPIPTSIDFDPLLGIPATVADAYGTYSGQPVNVSAPGLLANDSSNGIGPLAARLVSAPRRGTVTLSPGGSFTYLPNPGFVGNDAFTYRASNSAGLGTIATVTMSVAAAGTPLPPTNVRVLAISGGVVRLAWTVPEFGPRATSFVLEGGVAPGQVLGSVPLSAAPEVTLPLPPGVFYIRVRSVSGGATSLPSVERAVNVAQPARPSSPSNLLGLVNGASLALAWTNTYGGGAPTGVMLNVTGAYSGSLPLGLADRFDFNGVPPGTYTFSVSGLNAVGVSGPSHSVTLTFPGGCGGVPLPVSNLSAHHSAGAVFLRWDLPPDGPAPTSFVLNVSGSFQGSVPLLSRELSAPAPRGSYNISVAGVNACGTGSATSPVTVVVP